MGSLSSRPPTRSRASSTTALDPAGDQVAGGDEAGQTGADDRDVGLAEVLLHGGNRTAGGPRAAPRYPVARHVLATVARGGAPPVDRTLVIASIASATAAMITSQFWIAGTPIAAAMTPVIVALVSEMLHRPTAKIAERITSERAALPRTPPIPRPGGAADRAARAPGGEPPTEGMSVYRSRPVARARLLGGSPRSRRRWRS